MFLTFHQVRPEGTVDTMRRLRRLLGATAGLVPLFGLEPDIAVGGKVAQIKKGDQDAERRSAIRRSLEEGLRGLASQSDEGPERPAKGERIIEAELAEQLWSEKPSAVANAIDNFLELQTACAGIASATE